MSIDDPIQRAIDSGELKFMPMLVPGDPIQRVMLLGAEVDALIHPPFQDVHHERRIGRLRADLESFVKGEQISMSFTPFDHKSAYMGLLDPPGQATWEIRSRDPDPALRVFGRFAAEDVFVALGWAPRSTRVAWSRKEPLVDVELRWRVQIVDCEEKWNRLLPGIVPIAGGKVENYVSANAFAV